MQMCKLFTSVRSVLRIHARSWIQLRNISVLQWEMKETLTFHRRFSLNMLSRKFESVTPAGSVSYSSEHTHIENQWRVLVAQCYIMASVTTPQCNNVKAPFALYKNPVLSHTGAGLFSNPKSFRGISFQSNDTASNLGNLWLTWNMKVIPHLPAKITQLGIHWKCGRRFGGYISSILQEVVI